MVHIESIDNALSVGDFVVVLCDTIACSTPSSEGTPKKHKFGRIIDINNSGEKCHLNWWIRHSEEPILSPYIPTLFPTSSSVSLLLHVRSHRLSRQLTVNG